MKLLFLLFVIGSNWVLGFEEWNASKAQHSYMDVTPLMVDLTLFKSEDDQAVCLDGTLPGYHMDRGFGSGAKSWLIHLEGGGYCNNRSACVDRKTTALGSSKYMKKQMAFGGILSNKAEQNPDFFNWNRVYVRYCDGASFAGDSEDKSAGLQYRGQRIWIGAMQHLMFKGMKSADQALLSGCSAGGHAAILHCDQFSALFPKHARVKCLSDAGFFLDAVDAFGGRTLRNLYSGVVGTQRVEKNLPQICTNRLDPTLCFFPENLINNIKTPLFVLNPAYDILQIAKSLASEEADPKGEWAGCRKYYLNCFPSQIHFLQGFRNQMLRSLNKFSMSQQNGLFINSCFAHCQATGPDTWFANNSPVIANKAIAIAVGEWYFERSIVKAIDCPYPCDKSCHNKMT